MHYDAERGFSLGEVLIAAGIGLMLLGVLVRILIPALKHSAEGNIRLELQQFAVMAHQQIRAELYRSSAIGVSLGTSALLIHPQTSMDGTGQPVWSDETVLFYLDASNQLIRSQLPSRSVRPDRYTPTELNNLVNSSPATEKLVARFVRDFTVSSPAPDLPLEVELVLEKESPQRSTPIQISLTQNFSFRTAN